MGVDAQALEKPAFKGGAGQNRRDVMTDKQGKPPYKKFVLFAVGFFVLILGVTLILVWWMDVAVLFRGATGIILALAGLLTLYALNK